MDNGRVNHPTEFPPSLTWRMLGGRLPPSLPTHHEFPGRLAYTISSRVGRATGALGYRPVPWRDFRGLVVTAEPRNGVACSQPPDQCRDCRGTSCEQKEDQSPYRSKACHEILPGCPIASRHGRIHVHVHFILHDSPTGTLSLPAALRLRGPVSLLLTRSPKVWFPESPFPGAASRMGSHEGASGKSDGYCPHGPDAGKRV